MKNLYNFLRYELYAWDENFLDCEPCDGSPWGDIENDYTWEEIGVGTPAVNNCIGLTYIPR